MNVLFCRYQIGDGCGIFNLLDEQFPPGAIGFAGCKRCRPFTGSANPKQTLLWRSDEPQGSDKRTL